MNVINGKLQPKEKKLELQPLQLATIIILDACSTALQTGANQLGGFLKLEREASILMKALNVLEGEKQKLVQEWQQKIVVAPANTLIQASP